MWRTAVRGGGAYNLESTVWSVVWSFGAVAELSVVYGTDLDPAEVVGPVRSVYSVSEG